MLKMNTIKCDKSKEGGGDAPAAPATKTETPATPPKVEAKTETPKAEAAPAPAAKAVDEFGYEVDPKDAPKPAEKKPEEIKLDESTGYGENPPEVPEEEPAPPVTEPEIKLEYELDSKDVDEKEAVKIKEFAKTHKLTKEAAQAFMDLKRTELKSAAEAKAESEKQQAKAVATLKSNWFNELKNDPTFGGEQFKYNLMQAEKVLKDHLPETKKILTERKSMLPPYVMRDLAKLAAHLYSSDNFTQGEPTIPDKPVVNEKESHLSFYS